MHDVQPQHPDPNNQPHYHISDNNETRYWKYNDGNVEMETPEEDNQDFIFICTPVQNTSLILTR